MLNSESEVSSTIDWLAFTSDTEIIFNFKDQRSKESKTGKSHYSNQKRYLNGTTVLWHTERPEMGVHHILSGTALRNLRSDGTDVFLLLKVISRKASVTRIDIAVDLKHGSLDIEMLSEHLVHGDCVTKTTRAHYRKQLLEKGETLYIGSEKSDTYLRIYDKRYESGAEFDWTRVECQYRHNRAKAVTLTLVDIPDAKNAVGGLIKAFVDFPTVKDWCMMVGNEKIKPYADEKYKSNRRKWLLETAARALSEEMLTDTKMFQDFVDEALRLNSEKQRGFENS